ncbi:MAG: endonuclease/exonuclease/phosphatase family protein [Proteobacteria bacterium]|nr:endonuclease/exonuclease/phosphatase family protein [Pseudomonadota bacterium]
MEKNKAQTTIMTMNIRFGLARDKKNRWQHRKSLVERVLKKYPSDFLGVQEVNHFQADFLKTVLPGYGVMGQHNTADDLWQSNLIFSHPSWQCLEQNHYFLSDTPKVLSKLAGSRWPRQCVIGLFEKNADRILMVNTHFDFDPLVQEESAKLVINFISNFPRALPVVIVGDFNANPGSPAHRLFKDRGFEGVFDKEPITTFHGFDGRKTGQQIDWILYQGGLVPVFQQVVSDSFSGRFPSDHYPVRAGFDWPGF